MLRSPFRLLRRNLDPDPDLNLERNLDPDPDLNLELNIVVDAPDAVVRLDLFLLLLQGDLNLYPDLVLASKEDPPIPLLS